MTTPNPLIGTWKLLSCENHAPDGTITHVFGTQPLGYIFYRADGYMSVEMMAPNRTAFKKNDMWCGTESEDSQAIKSYLSYCGRYTFQKDRVVHHIEVSSFPNWSGKDELRYVQLQDDKLILTTPPTSYQGMVQTGKVTWQKVA